MMPDSWRRDFLFHPSDPRAFLIPDHPKPLSATNNLQFPAWKSHSAPPRNDEVVRLVSVKK
jgi:hypothetical protein